MIAGPGAAPVAGNTAVITPEFTAFVAVAPANVKLISATPVSVNPFLAVKIMDAVYSVPAAKVDGTAGFQSTVPEY